MRPLSFHVEFSLTNYREPEKLKSLADGIADYQAAKEQECKQDRICGVQLAKIKSELKRLRLHFPGKSVAELPSSALVTYLEMGDGALKTSDILIPRN